MLSQEQWAVAPRTLADIEYDEDGGKLILNRKGERFVKADAVAEADVTLPLVASFVPIAKHAFSGNVLWGTDIVDGFHRLAAAKIKGLTEMPLVLAPPLPSAIVTKPKADFIGPIAPESNMFEVFDLPDRPSSFYAELSKHIGTRFSYRIEE